MDTFANWYEKWFAYLVELHSMHRRLRDSYLDTMDNMFSIWASMSNVAAMSLNNQLERYKTLHESLIRNATKSDA